MGREFMDAMDAMGFSDQNTRPLLTNADEHSSERDNHLDEEDRIFEEAFQNVMPEDAVGTEDKIAACTQPSSNPYHGTNGTVLRRIRHGEIKAAGSLDLHGLTQDKARKALDRFIRHSQREEHRMVLVIVGQGYHSRQHAVLQQAVPRWLREDLADIVLRILPAPREFGGAGALCVILREAKPR